MRAGIVCLVLLLFLNTTSARNKVYALTFQGSDTGYAIIGNEAWNIFCLLDSILRTTVENVDTVISLWGWGLPGPPNEIIFPKYRIPFVDGRASVAKLDTVTAWFAQTSAFEKIPSLMTKANFSQLFNIPSSQLKIVDISGRCVRPEDIKPGIYFLFSQLHKSVKLVIK